jgi:hypothetical protein
VNALSAKGHHEVAGIPPGNFKRHDRTPLPTPVAFGDAVDRRGPMPQPARMLARPGLRDRKPDVEGIARSGTKPEYVDVRLLPLLETPGIVHHGRGRLRCPRRTSHIDVEWSIPPGERVIRDVEKADAARIRGSRVAIKSATEPPRLAPTTPTRA